MQWRERERGAFQWPQSNRDPRTSTIHVHFIPCCCCYGTPPPLTLPTKLWHRTHLPLYNTSFSQVSRSPNLFSPSSPCRPYPLSLSPRLLLMRAVSRSHPLLHSLPITICVSLSHKQIVFLPPTHPALGLSTVCNFWTLRAHCGDENSMWVCDWEVVI